jgi:regulator of sirC expression with transglutaminase-like and TPR domain
MAYAFRAAAYRYVDSLDLALDDAERAVQIGPELPEGWLERGILRRIKGNIAGARADWLRVLVLEPEGLAGDTARANIERLELSLTNEPANLPARKR